MDDITVAVCTWNRARLFQDCLESLAALQIPEGLRTEVLIVDNASSDDTRTVVESFRRRLPIRYLYEPALGLSNARNCAVAQAQGQFIVWIDDDARVEAEWPVAYVAGIEKHAEAAVFGGPIEPEFEVPPPPWMRQTWPMISRYYAIKSMPEETSIHTGNLPKGANFAIRTDVQRRYSYNPAEGRRGDVLFSGDESTVIRRVLNDGGTGVWVPEARVRHHLPARRMTLQYLRRTVRDSGKQAALRRIAVGNDAALNHVQLLGCPRWLWRRALVLYVAYLTRRLRRGDPELWMPPFLQFRLTWGTIEGYREHSGKGSARLPRTRTGTTNHTPRTKRRV